LIWPRPGNAAGGHRLGCKRGKQSDRGITKPQLETCSATGGCGPCRARGAACGERGRSRERAVLTSESGVQPDVCVESPPWMLGCSVPQLAATCCSLLQLAAACRSLQELAGACRSLPELAGACRSLPQMRARMCEGVGESSSSSRHGRWRRWLAPRAAACVRGRSRICRAVAGRVRALAGAFVRAPCGQGGAWGFEASDPSPSSRFAAPPCGGAERTQRGAHAARFRPRDSLEPHACGMSGPVGLSAARTLASSRGTARRFGAVPKQGKCILSELGSHVDLREEAGNV
jgi:hypothetical protein